MTHAYHEKLPGFAPDQILHDGCDECEERAQRTDHGLSSLDSSNFALAWRRAAQFNQRGLADVSYAEMPLLNTLWSVQLHFERRGIAIGALPSGSFVEFP